MALLHLDDVTTYYGKMRILEGISIEVDAGELVCLLGGNASGKSTTLKTILGIVRRRRAHRPRPGDRSREPSPVRLHDGAREPRTGRGAAQGRTARRGLRPGSHAIPAPA